MWGEATQGDAPPLNSGGEGGRSTPRPHLVEEEVPRVPNEGARDGDSLLLAARELAAARAAERREAVLKGRNEVDRVGVLRSTQHVGGDIGVDIGNSTLLGGKRWRRRR